MSSQTPGPANPNGYLTSSASEVKGGPGEVVATSHYLCTAWVNQVTLHIGNGIEKGIFN